MSNEVAARIWAEIGGRPLIVLVPDLDDRSLSVAAQQRLAFPALKNVEDEDDDEGEYDLALFPSSALLCDLRARSSAVTHHDPIQNDLRHGEVVLFEINQRLISVIADH